MYLYAEKEGRFSMVAVVAFFTATSLGVGYMLASRSEIDTVHEALEQYFDAVKTTPDKDRRIRFPTLAVHL